MRAHGAVLTAPAALPRRWSAATRRRWAAAGLLAPAGVVLAALFAYPLVNILGISFLANYPGPAPLTGKHYAAFVVEPYFLRVTLTTFELAVTVTLLAILVGYPVAYYFVRSRSRHKHLIFICVISPLLVSIVVRTLGWTILLGNEGLINRLLLGLGLIGEPLKLLGNFWAVVVGMVHVLLPFMVLSIAGVLGKIDPSLTESAAILGANPARAFLRVTLPLSIQGIAAGSVLVFCLTIGAFITPWWLGRGKILLFATTILDQILVLIEWPFGAAASMLLVAMTLAILLAYFTLIARVGRR
jgi:putative spermidine/putrescine transport system permease protein